LEWNVYSNYLQKRRELLEWFFERSVPLGDQGCCNREFARMISSLSTPFLILSIMNIAQQKPVEHH